jgi:hypothetical protein
MMLICCVAQKYVANPKIFEDIRLQSTSLAAKKRNTYWKKQYPVNMTSWKAKRDNVMLTALTAKFTDNELLGDALIATGDRSLHEVPGRNGEKYWEGGNGAHDRLGQLLMQVRTLLRTNRNSTTTIDSKELDDKKSEASTMINNGNDGKRHVSPLSPSSSSLSSSSNETTTNGNNPKVPRKRQRTTTPTKSKNVTNQPKTIATTTSVSRSPTSSIIPAHSNDALATKRARLEPINLT